MESRRWGSTKALLMAAFCLIPAAGHQNEWKNQCTEIPPAKPAAEQPKATPISVPAAAQTSPEQLVTASEISCLLTAYSPDFESTGKHPGDPGYGITASGMIAKEGRTIAVDPSLIPLGSDVYIEGIGIRHAEDTGGAVKGPHIDVFFNSPNDAIHFGVKRDVHVRIIKRNNS